MIWISIWKLCLLSTLGAHSCKLICKSFQMTEWLYPRGALLLLIFSLSLSCLLSLSLYLLCPSSLLSTRVSIIEYWNDSGSRGICFIQAAKGHVWPDGHPASVGHRAVKVLSYVTMCHCAHLFWKLFPLSFHLVLVSLTCESTNTSVSLQSIPKPQWKV